jgi:hypothetical protein
MNDQELRQLVRAAVARHLSGSHAAPSRPIASELSTFHPSHGLYIALVNTTEQCAIEPAVTCDHCGYCKSHGH